MILYPKGDPARREELEAAIKYRLEKKMQLSVEFLKRDESRLGIEAALTLCFGAIADADEELFLVKEDERTGLGEYVLPTC